MGYFLRCYVIFLFALCVRSTVLSHALEMRAISGKYNLHFYYLYEHQENMSVKCIPAPHRSSPLLLVYIVKKNLGFSGVHLLLLLFLFQNIDCVY